MSEQILNGGNEDTINYRDWGIFVLIYVHVYEKNTFM